MKAVNGGSNDFVQVEWGQDVLAQIGVRVKVSLGEAEKEIENSLTRKDRRRLTTLAGEAAAAPGKTDQLAEAVSRTRKAGAPSQRTPITSEVSSTRTPATARPSQYIPI